MKSMSWTEIVSLGLMLFSIFFGAGNLIFPPALGQAAGENLWPAIFGFLVTGVGLPLLGVLAVALVGGSYTETLAKRINPKFVTILLATLYLTIGPLFAVPRTGAVAFEIGISNFLSPENFTLGRFVYTLVFFGATYYLALNPHKIVDRVGKMLTPILLFFLALLLGQVFFAPLGTPQPATGNYQSNAFLQGFLDGYLTMDLLASIAIGTIVVNAVRDRGITNPFTVTKICSIAGVISVLLMSAVYISLGYLGATSTEVLGYSDNGGIILTNVAFLYFGRAGNLILAMIITFACLTTSCGMVSACADFFANLFKNKITYRTLVLVFSLFGMATANVGLTALISFSIPFLVMIYPVIIVLVILSLLHNAFQGRREVYLYSLFTTLAFSVFSGLQAANISIGNMHELFTQYLPLYSESLGWIVPAMIGAVVGYIVSFLQAIVCGENA